MIWLDRIGAAFSRFAGLFADRFLRQEPPLLPPPVDAPLLPSIIELPRMPVVVPEKVPEIPKTTPEKTQPDSFGQFFFRETILDDLGLYMRFIRRMRISDPCAYGLYSRIGARVIPASTVIYADAIEPWFAQTQPAFGCVAMGIDKGLFDEEAATDDRTHPRFMYFTKYDQPPAAIQRGHGGAVYLVSAFFDPAHSDAKRGWELQFAISVNKAGVITPLKIQAQRVQTVPSRRHGTAVITHNGWSYCPAIRDWAAEHNASPEEYQRRLFTMVANAWAMSHASMIHVTATNSAGLTAAFGVDIKRTPYFFADREVSVNARGRKARIFHMVKGHKRTTRNGRTVNVRMHFSGLRRFQWNGYEVRISVPGWHHADLAEMQSGALDQDRDLPIPKGMTDMAGTGRFLAAHVKNGWQQLQRAGARQ